jgi:tripartite-type tricarboxylate transporter receptor subunit TctC
MKLIFKWVMITFICSMSLSLSANEVAKNYPNKPITFIVAYGAGGGADSRSRQIANALSTILGQPVIVENKAGAGGNIGTDLIAKAKPDGYTIGMGNFAPLAVNQALFKNLRFDPLNDLAPIVLIDKGPLVLTVNQSSTLTSLPTIINTAKAKPGTLTFASGGIGGSHQLSAELFKINAGIDMIHVPYKSGAAATTDLIAGNVDMMFEQMYSAMPNIKSGKLRPIAITSKKRSVDLKDVPTFAELGFPKVEVLNWQGLIAPKGTPKEIIQKLNVAANQALKDPKIRDAILSQNNEIGGGTPQEFGALIQAELIKWTQVVKTANLKPE